MENKLLGASAGALLFVGVALGVAIAPSEKADGEVRKASAELKSMKAEAEQFDSKAYADAVNAARAADPQLVDLLTAVIPAGGDVAAGANLPLGARLLSAQLTGDAVDNFEITTSECLDQETATNCVIHARNTSDTDRRLTAFVRWEVPK